MMSAAIRSFAAAMLAASLGTAQAGEWGTGNYFTSYESVIQEFTPDGQLLKSLTLPPFGQSGFGESRGIAFGPDGLYVVRSNTFDNGIGDAGVQVVDSSANVLKTYLFPGWLGGLVTAGDLKFAPGKESFYVSAQDGIYRFKVGGTKGRHIIPAVTGSVDLAVLRNGNLLVANDYGIAQYTADGTKVGATITTLQDPYGLTSGDPWLVDIRGIAYDASTNTTFVAMLGYSGFDWELLALDGVSNVIKGATTYWYGCGLKVTRDGHLLVGSWTQAPGVFSYTDSRPGVFTQVRQLGTQDAVFVTSKGQAASAPASR